MAKVLSDQERTLLLPITTKLSRVLRAGQRDFTLV
jgi:hypothetical protein